MSASRDCISEVQWRRRATVLRHVVQRATLDELDLERIRRIVGQLPYIRAFVPTSPHNRRRVQHSYLVPAPASSAMFADLVESSLTYTVLMNAVEQVDPVVNSVRDQLQVPFSWREDDIVLTYSTVGSGIGYHAGHEDAFIVQASGRRLWRVWDATEMAPEPRRRLILSNPDDIYVFDRSTAPPIIECELEPGDALYIPPFFPHEGVTLETSVSIALGWRGIAYYHLLLAFPRLLRAPANSTTDERFFELVPDFEIEGNQDAIALTVHSTIERLGELGCEFPDCRALARRLFMLFSGAGAPVA